MKMAKYIEMPDTIKNFFEIIRQVNCAFLCVTPELFSMSDYNHFFFNLKRDVISSF